MIGSKRGGRAGRPARDGTGACGSAVDDSLGAGEGSSLLVRRVAVVAARRRGCGPERRRSRYSKGGRRAVIDDTASTPAALPSVARRLLSTRPRGRRGHRPADASIDRPGRAIPRPANVRRRQTGAVCSHGGQDRTREVRVRGTACPRVSGSRRESSESQESPQAGALRPLPGVCRAGRRRLQRLSRPRARTHARRGCGCGSAVVSTLFVLFG